MNQPRQWLKDTRHIRRFSGYQSEVSIIYSRNISQQDMFHIRDDFRLKRLVKRRKSESLHTSIQQTPSINIVSSISFLRLSYLQRDIVTVLKSAETDKPIERLSALYNLGNILNENSAAAAYLATADGTTTLTRCLGGTNSVEIQYQSIRCLEYLSLLAALV